MEFLGLMLVGLLAGTYGSLIGAGGGFIMVPILILLFPSKLAATITAISLIAVFFTGLSSTIAYARQKRIDYRIGVIFLITAIPGSIIGALVVSFVPQSFFQIMFGVLLAGLAIYIFFKPRKEGTSTTTTNGTLRRLVDNKGTVYEYKVNQKIGIGMTGGVGFLAAMLGVGGGIINTPLFVVVLKIPIHIATATSQVIISGSSLAANITNILEGDLNDQWIIALALTIGAIIGAQLGARVSQKIKTPILTKCLALGLFIVGVNITVRGVQII